MIPGLIGEPREFALTAKRPALNVGSGRKYFKGWINLDRFLGEDQQHGGEPQAPDVLADARHLPVKKGSIATVYMGHVLEHLEHPLIALVEAYRVLNSKGQIRVEVPHPKRIKSERNTHLYSWTKSTLHNIIQRAGFDIRDYYVRRNNHGVEATK